MRTKKEQTCVQNFCKHDIPVLLVEARELLSEGNWKRKGLVPCDLKICFVAPIYVIIDVIVGSLPIANDVVRSILFFNGK